MRILALIAMAMIVAIVEVQPLYGQELSFDAVNNSLVGVGNKGVTGASPRTGFLNTAINDGLGLQANFLPNFNAVDVAAGDFNANGSQDIVAIAASDTNGDGIPDTGQLVIFYGLNDGTFQLPRVIKTAGIPVALAVSDIDLDGIPDIAVAEQGFVEVFTGFFLITGKTISLDRFGNPNAIPPGKALKTAPGNNVVSIVFTRVDNDPVPDIVVAEQEPGEAMGMFEVFLTAKNGIFAYNPSGTAEIKMNTVGTIGVTPSGPIPAPRALAVPLTQLSGGGGLPVVTPLVPTSGVIFIATSQGVEIFDVVNNPIDPNTPSFMADFNSPLQTPTGSLTIGVLATVNSQGILDLVIALNRGLGTLSTFTASSGFNVSIESPVGNNPVSLTPINFNNDGKMDLAVVNDSATGEELTVLTGNNAGFFKPPISPDPGKGLRLFNPHSVIVGRFNSSSQTQDIVIADGAVAGVSPGGVLYLSAARGYKTVPLQIFTAASFTTSFDGVGSDNDIVIIEQDLGIVFVLLNVSSDAPTSMQVRMLDIRDLFTSSTVTPTSATAFKDPQTGLNDLAITDVGTPTNTNGFGQIIVGINDGSGDFTNRGRFRQFVATPGATNLQSGDFNNDGTDDLVYIDFLSNFAAVALNDGKNTFLSPKFRETGGFVPVSAAIADVNDDDNLDLVVLNQGAGNQVNQSIVSVLLGQGNGQLVPTGSLLQVPNSALSIVGGLADFGADSMRRMVDFNNDGFPDFAVASTRGSISTIGLPVAAVTLLLNRPDSPGNFIVQKPIPLIDDTPSNAFSSLVLDADKGGPGIISGRGNLNPSIVGLGGANYIMAVGDFNADGSPDLVVTGTRQVNFGTGTAPINVNFRSSIYLIGNETAGTMRIVRPQRSAEYGGANPFAAGGDTFIACVTGKFSSLTNGVPDVFHVSLNGQLWVDSNSASILNHAPILTISRLDLNAPFPGGGRKEIITAGEPATIPVIGFDPDGDLLTFSLAQIPTGQKPPSFVTIQDNRNNTAAVIINSADINHGSGDLTFRIAVEASDTPVNGSSGRLPLTGRTYFTLVVKPNNPPVIAPIANQTVEPGQTTTIQLSVSDKEGQKVTTSAKCDKGNFVTVTGTVLTIAPQISDVGTSTCMVTATDSFGLSSSITFLVTVDSNQPPTIAPIADQQVKAGEVRTVSVSASDPSGPNGLRLSILSSPAFVSLLDNGNGTGTIRIAPALTDTQGGRVTVQVIDQGGRSAQTSFNVIVQPAVTITAAAFVRPNLFINGFGFGSAGAKVSVNGKDISPAIIRQSDTSITLKGSKKKLNLKSGPNQLVVSAGGAMSNAFVLNLLASDRE